MVSTNSSGFGQKLVESARQLYADLAYELAQAMQRLRDDYLAEETKSLADMLKAHRKALQTVLDFELSFLKSQKEEEKSDELDLDAARSEIRSRLDRLAAAGGDRKPD